MELGLKPLTGVPRVRVLDENGKIVLSGYYLYKLNRMPCVIDDSLKQEDVDHCVARIDGGDWNLPETFHLVKVTSPHTIEIIEDDV